MKKIEWKMASFAKGIKPEDAQAELERIESVFGGLTPETLLTASMDESALFHKLFQWDDDKAATQYRLQQARTILNNIEVTVISDGLPKKIAAYEVVNLGEGRVYKYIENMDSKDIEYIKSSAKREIKYLKNKLSVYSDFEKTITFLDDALGSL